jgi:hypothetical protein
MKDWEKLYAANYAQKRLNDSFGRGNDRLSAEKQHADAVLRGMLGSEKANRIIGAMDEIKYGVNSYKRGW